MSLADQATAVVTRSSALLEVYVATGYDAASDMLTRTTLEGDMAPNVGFDVSQTND